MNENKIALWWTFLDYFLPDGRRRWMIRREVDGVHVWVDGPMAYVLQVAQEARVGLSGPTVLRGRDLSEDADPNDIHRELCAIVDREHPPNAAALAAYIAEERDRSRNPLGGARAGRDIYNRQVAHHEARLAALDAIEAKYAAP